MTTNHTNQVNQRRKDDHLRYALEQQASIQASRSPFDDIRFVHHSLNQVNPDAVILSTHWADYTHSWPFYINAMTGGSKLSYQYNKDLALVAKEADLAIASGSISAALSNPEVADSFKVMREVNPNGFILANLGAHHSLENAKRATDLIQANALQLHLNVPQEVVMPEGDRDFRMWLDHIALIVDQLNLPVIVKEVGFGMSRETIQALLDVGVQTVDISGRGGTNFVQIENDRRHHGDLTQLLTWGQTTPESLLEAQAFLDQVTLLASGGIQNALDMVKCFALGAKGVGISGLILGVLEGGGVDSTIDFVRQLQSHLHSLALLLNCQSLEDFTRTDLIISGDLKNWADLRGIDPVALAHRSTTLP